MDASEDIKTDDDRNEVFLRLLNEHERALTIYVRTLVPDWSEGQDVLQETRLRLWREFHRFEIGTNFIAWARTVAFYQVLTHRKQIKRAPLPLSEEFLHRIAEAISEDPERWDHRAEALQDCVKKLPTAHRSLIALRYYEEQTIEEVAQAAGRTTTATYRALSRIRRSLEDCISQTMQKRPS